MPTLADLTGEPEPEADDDALAERNLAAARHLNAMLRVHAGRQGATPTEG